MATIVRSAGRRSRTRRDGSTSMLNRSRTAKARAAELPPADGLRRCGDGEPPPDGQVLGHAQHREDRQVLVDEVQAGRPRPLGRGPRRLLGRLPDGDGAAGVALRDAGQDLDQAALARAVAPDEAVHGAALDLDRDVVEGEGAREGLRQVLDREHRPRAAPAAGRDRRRPARGRATRRANRRRPALGFPGPRARRLRRISCSCRPRVGHGRAARTRPDYFLTPQAFS